MAKNKFVAMFKRISWEPVIAAAVLLLIVIAATLFLFYKPLVPQENARLSAEVIKAYTEAVELASVYGDSTAAIKRLDLEFDAIDPSSKKTTALYTEAKLTIYKADIMLTYSGDFETGFALLGDVFVGRLYDDSVRSEALSLAMAHAVQALEEGLLTPAQVRDYVLLDKNFKNTLNVGLADAMLIDKPFDTYKYLVHGFEIAMDMTPSEKVYLLSESYKLRLTAPFVIPPPTGGYYYGFIASLENFESRLDELVAQYDGQNMPYQEFVATSYYNIARAYENAPQGEVDVTSKMAQIHDKLATYLKGFPSAYGTQAYLLSINTRLICKAVDAANFDSTNIDIVKLQPHLDELYASEGWVVPCKEAFEFISRDIDTRFAKYF